MKNPVFALWNSQRRTVLASFGMAALLILSACGTDIPATPPTPVEVVPSSVSDAANGGNPYFYWTTNRV
jgi:hypothetical protein